MAKSDAELMKELQQGRDDAFAELVARHRRPLLNYFYKLLWDRQLSEDFCQEVFCRVFRHRDRYVPSASFATYLYRIGRNLWIDRYRSERHSPVGPSLDVAVDNDGHAMSGLLAADVQDPSHQAEQADEVLRVRRALDCLAPELKETLILVKYQGLKYAEAAAALEVPIGTIRSRIHAAVEQIRDRLNVEADAREG